MKETLYKLVDLLTLRRGLARRINGFNLRLPARYVNYFPSNYESENFKFLQSSVKEGDVVLDAGAHIGLFSTIAASISGANGKVYSFEPAAQTFRLLQETIRINHLTGQVIPYNAAVGERSGKVTFFVSPIKGDNSNSMVSYKDDRELKPVEVDMMCIDDLVKKEKLKPSFIKIDVEGAELDALRGAAQTLITARPVLILAVHPQPVKEKGDSIEAICHFIRTHNYRCYLHGKLVSEEDLVNLTDLFDLHLLPE